jgi:hypothetical protein
MGMRYETRKQQVTEPDWLGGQTYTRWLIWDLHLDKKAPFGIHRDAEAAERDATRRNERYAQS